MKRGATNNKGFSLVELIIVIAIMAILVGVMAPQLIKYIEKTKVAADTQLCDAFHKAVYYALMDPEVVTAEDGSEVWVERFTNPVDEWGGGGSQHILFWPGAGYDTTDCAFLRSVTETLGFNPWTTNPEDQGWKSTPMASFASYGLKCMAVVSSDGMSFATYVNFSDRYGEKDGSNYHGTYEDIEDSRVIFVK